MAAVSILSYLHYLHDVNRKLLQRGGLENVLYRKASSQTPYYHQLDQADSSRPRHWLGALRHIQNSEARGLSLRPLVGLGLVVGQITTQKGNKRLCAPFAFCNAQLIEDESVPNVVALEILWDSVTLNYDLLTLFVGQAQEEETEDTGLAQVGLGGPTLAVFTDIENDLERLAVSANPEANLDARALAKLAKYVRDNVKDFETLSLPDATYDHKALDSLIQKRPASFFPHRFFFIAPAAGELTTMMALSALIRQTEGG